MKFYNREEELKILENHYKNLKGIVIETIVGRRRIGKTELAKKFTEKKPYFYFFVSRKPLEALLSEWSEIVRIHYPEIGTYDDLGKFIDAVLTIIDKNGKGVVIFDEFQNFKYIYPPAFSIFQQCLDQHKKTKKVQIIFIGSLFTLMNKIFSDSKEPLFGRATGRIHLKPFDFKLIAQILKDFQTREIENIFKIYSIFNGIPKYYSVLEEEFGSDFKFNKILGRIFFDSNASLKNEGYYLLREEFGRDFDRYFEILSLISAGYNTVGKIADKMKIPASTVSTYCLRLEKDHQLIEKRIPVFSGGKARNGRYFLGDVFLTFWFRYIFKNSSFLEFGAGDKIKKKTLQDFPTFSGLILEKIFLELFLRDENLLSKKGIKINISEIGQYWDKRGKYDIDLVITDKKRSLVLIGECKLNHNRINGKAVNTLIEKGDLDIFKNYKHKQLAFFVLKKEDLKLKERLKNREINIFSLEEIISTRQ